MGVTAWLCTYVPSSCPDIEFPTKPYFFQSLKALTSEYKKVHNQPPTKPFHPPLQNNQTFCFHTTSHVVPLFGHDLKSFSNTSSHPQQPHNHQGMACCADQGTGAPAYTYSSHLLALRRRLDFSNLHRRYFSLPLHLQCDSKS